MTCRSLGATTEQGIDNKHEQHTERDAQRVGGKICPLEGPIAQLALDKLEGKTEAEEQETGEDGSARLQARRSERPQHGIAEQVHHLVRHPASAGHVLRRHDGPDDDNDEGKYQQDAGNDDRVAAHRYWDHATRCSASRTRRSASCSATRAGAVPPKADRESRAPCTLRT